MDIIIILIGVVFLGIVAALAYSLLNEQSAGKINTIKTTKDDFKKEEAQSDRLSNRKITEYEERIKKLENELELTKTDFVKIKEIKEKLSEEKSHIVFDMEQYEKFKKEHQELKNEIVKKEGLLEKEISLRRTQSQELTQIQQDHKTAKQKIAETEDALRKAQGIIETLKKTIDDLKKQLSEHSKIVNEYSEKKSEGQWVSREEFNKIEAELKEKENMLQKLLSLKKET